MVLEEDRLSLYIPRGPLVVKDLKKNIVSITMIAYYMLVAVLLPVFKKIYFKFIYTMFIYFCNGRITVLIN